MAKSHPKRFRRSASGRHALFPGTFDPVTLGHVDLVRRAAAVFDHVTVAVACHPSKHELLQLELRIELLREVAREFENVDVATLDGLVVDGCRKLGARVILRGLRTASDVDYELAMARSNRAMAPEIETVLFASSPEHAHISSTLVRQIARMGGDLSPFVSAGVRRALTRLRRK